MILRFAVACARPGRTRSRELPMLMKRVVSFCGLEMVRVTIVRWPRGAQDEIEVPPHPAGRYGGGIILATFHTHPNAGPNHQQEPSPTDIRAVRLDPDFSIKC